MNVNNTANVINNVQLTEQSLLKTQPSAGNFFSDFFNNFGNASASNRTNNVPERRDSHTVNNSAQSQNRQQPNNVERRNDVTNERLDERSRNEQQPEVGTETVRTREEVENAVCEVVAAERETIRNIADTLGITAEQLAEILAMLGLTVLDLTDKQNVDNLLLMVFNMERPSDLLNLPGIVGMFNDINEAAADFNDLIESVDLTALKAELLDSKTNLLQDGNNQHFAYAIEEANQNPLFANGADVKDEVVEVMAQPAAVLEGDAESAEDNLLNLQNSEGQTAVRAENQSSSGNTGGQQENPLMGGEQAVNSIVYENKNAGQIAANSFEISSSGQAAKAETLQPRSSVSASDIVNQMLEKMKVDVRANITEVRMTLRPEALGDVSLKIITERGIVTAQFLAENERVKEIIESNFNILKDALEKQGVSISSLSVEVGSEKGQQMLEEYERGRHLSAERIRQIMGIALDDEELESEAIQNVEGNEVNYYA
ncbi:MAG: flagellar hook-length control protein FliK [Defluviitaleaceae bacterium]|nr:flagellar hook-length control protein FliK [Defluviitaleaceae bacterium]